MCIKKRILACFKITHDLDSVIEEDWNSAADESFCIDYTKRIISGFDEAALETALRIGDQREDVHTTALTVNSEPIGDFIKNLYAIGFDQVVQIKGGEDLHFCPKTVARLIAGYIRKEGGFDVVVTGGEAPPGDNRQIPYLLGELTGMPCMDLVTDLQLTPDGWMVARETQSAKELYMAKDPAIYAMENARYTYLRVATLREKLAASKKQAGVFTAEELDVRDQGESEMEIKRFYPARKTRVCHSLGNDPKDAAGKIIKDYLGQVLNSERLNG